MTAERDPMTLNESSVPALWVLGESVFEGTELIYSDPPYLKRTRSSRRRYRYDYEEADHVELLELLKAVPCQVMVSGYGSALYEERLEGWRSVALQVMNHAGVRTECVWMNFPADRLHWVRGHRGHRHPPALRRCGGARLLGLVSELRALRPRLVRGTSVARARLHRRRP